MAESDEELRNLLRVDESEKASLKHNILKKTQKPKITVSGPSTSWQIGEKVEAVTDFFSSWFENHSKW